MKDIQTSEHGDYTAHYIFDKDWGTYIAFVERRNDYCSILEYTDSDDDLEILIQRTDKAMYELFTQNSQSL